MRILWASNWSAQSSYALQSQMIVPRLKALGHDVTVFELMNGTRRAYESPGNIKVLSCVIDPLGNDVIRDYAIRTKADAVITLIDVWRFDASVWAQVPWYPYCVPGDTLIHTTDDRTLTIKEIVDGRLPVKIWGVKDNELVETDVTHYHDIDANEAGELLEVKTSAGKTLLVTADNLIAVNKHGSLKWVRADLLFLGDMVYCINTIPREGANSDDEPCTQGNREIQATVDGYRMGLRGGDIRRGRYDQYLTGVSVKNAQTPITTNDQRSEYEPRTDRMVMLETGYENKYPQSNHAAQFSIQQGHIKRSLLCNPSGWVQDVFYRTEHAALFDYQEKTGRDSAGIHQLKDGSFGGQLPAPLLGSGYGFVETDTGFKCETVISISKLGRPEPTVYDLTTTVGNFFAGNVLIHNCPIDHTPVPPAVVGALNSARKVVAMSRFGVDELAKVGCEALYVPLAYDPQIWYSADKAATRATLGIPEDTFWVSFIGVNDSNPSRKGIPELLTAWQMFASKHPNAVLYMHTALHGNIAMSGPIGGVKIDHLMSVLRLTDQQVRMVDQFEYRTGIPTSKLAAMVAASDAVVLPSRGEGFGLPLLEAQAVGTPVITTKFAAGQELVKAGWMVEGESEWSYQDSFVLKPGILSLAEAFENAYEQRHNKHIRQIAAQGVTDYQIDNVVNKYWRPALTTIAETTLEALRAS